MAKRPPTKIPPRSKGSGNGSGGSRGASPRPPRKSPPPRRRGGSSRGRAYGIVAGIVVLIAAAVIVVIISTSGGSSSSANAHQPAVNYTTTAGVKIYGGLGPEGIPLQIGTQLAEPNTGLTGAPITGLQCNTQEQLTYHNHAHLVIFINGQLRTIPIGVGMVPPAQVEQTSTGDWATGSQDCLYWLHVHAQDGIIHIESPTPKTYELAQFFAIWHQTLSANQIGPYAGKVTATVNGKPWAGDPGQIPLTEHAQIVLNLGGPIVTPPPVDWSGTSL